MKEEMLIALLHNVRRHLKHDEKQLNDYNELVAFIEKNMTWKEVE